MTLAIRHVYKTIMTELSATAEESEKGLRLDSFLSQRFETLSRSRAKTLIQEVGAVCEGERLTNPRQKVVAGKAYSIELPAPVAAEPEPEDIKLDILFEDEHLLLVNKPVDMAVHPAPGSWTGTLVNALLHYCGDSLPGIGGVQRPGIVHRIDKQTSGVLAVAKSDAAHQGLSALFAAHDIERKYIALTRGAPRPLAGTVDAPIARSLIDRKKMAVVGEDEGREGRHAVTHYKTLHQYGQISKVEARAAAAMIECQLETGRTHQIRVHMAHLGTPLIGDSVYGRHRGIKSHGNSVAHDEAMQVARGLRRQALHAASLGFVHPVTGERVFAETPLPEDMAAVVAALKTL